MKYAAPLYLASGSRMRRELLTHAKYPFSSVPQYADESTLDWQQDPTILVRELSRLKMAHALLPQGTECFVITADTVCVDIYGAIHGKPKDHADAVTMLKLWRKGSTVITGFCIDKKVYTTSWETIARIEEVVSTEIDLCIPDEWLETYLKETPLSLSCAGAMVVEDFGSFPFVKSINGSYSNIMGLPMYEVRQALERLSFFLP